MAEKKYTIKHDKEKCISCRSCELIAPKVWSMNKDGKVELLKKEITKEELKDNLKAAEYCPVKIIQITDKKTKKIVT